MNNNAKERRYLRHRRHERIKKKVRGTAQRPRLVVFRSLKHLDGQLVDDDKGVTLADASTRVGGSGDADERTGKVAASYVAGVRLADKAMQVGVTDVVFDRGGSPYHGRVKAFAEGARKGGLRF